jgi:hypothetical protein
MLVLGTIKSLSGRQSPKWVEFTHVSRN